MGGRSWCNCRVNKENFPGACRVLLESHKLGTWWENSCLNPKRMPPPPHQQLPRLFSVCTLLLWRHLKVTRYRWRLLSVLVHSLGKHSPKSPRRDPVGQSAASSGPTRAGSPWGSVLSEGKGGGQAAGAWHSRSSFKGRARGEHTVDKGCPWQCWGISEESMKCFSLLFL